MDHPVLGRNKFQNAPFKLSATPAVHRSAAPLIGEHTQEVLEGMLGLSHAEVIDGVENNIFWPKSLDRFDYIDAIATKGPWQEVAIAPPKPAKVPAAPAASGPGPLDGLRVLELSDETGQFTGKLMADLGADVIKIEPLAGEGTRSVGPFLDDQPHRDRSLSFWHYNTSKRGITLNLETEDGRDLFRRLAADADVVLETFAPGYMASLGLGYECLKAARAARGATTRAAIWCIWRRAASWAAAVMTRPTIRSRFRSRPVAAVPGIRQGTSPTWQFWPRWSIATAPAKGNISTPRCMTVSP
jgi:hypothetical protein